jgi:tetratricopeptide (TPR) repeat protein
MRRRGCLSGLLAIPAIILLSLGIYFLPPVHSRLGWRVENWTADLRRALAPESQVVFVPQEQNEQLDAIVQATWQALLQPTQAAATALADRPVSPTPTPAAVNTQPAATSEPNPMPTATPTSIPDRVILEGIRYQAQSFNNCGPANLAMALSFWGWQGDQRDTRSYLRPNLEVDDKNIMPEEMVRFVETQTGLKALTRVNGDLDLLKRFIAAGFPVIIEKGHHPPGDWWMGHYMVINGYNDNQARFTAQDSLIQENAKLAYEEVIPWWRDFNYVYLVIYPPEREAEVLAVLGAQADTTYNYQLAAQRGRDDIASLDGRDLYFAWFNLGSSLVALGDAAGAAEAYDQAFAINASLPDKQRLYRMLWYQIGPYEAYYGSGRYQDVIDLGNATLAWVGKPVLEETYYWMGMAREATHDMDKAVKDYTRAAELNPNYDPPRQALVRLGVESP